MFKKFTILISLFFISPCFANSDFIDGQIRSELPINIPQPVSKQTQIKPKVQTQTRIQTPVKIQEKTPIQTEITQERPLAPIQNKIPEQTESKEEILTQPVAQEAIQEQVSEPGEEIQEQAKQETEEELSEEMKNFYRGKQLERLYALEAYGKILENWKPVNYLAGNMYKNNVTVEVKINKSGNIETNIVAHSMHDKKAETNALKAVEAAAPFAPFPDLIRKERMILRVKFGEYSNYGPSFRFE